MPVTEEQVKVIDSCRICFDLLEVFNHALGQIYILGEVLSEVLIEQWILPYEKGILAECRSVGQVKYFPHLPYFGWNLPHKADENHLQVTLSSRESSGTSDQLVF